MSDHTTTAAYDTQTVHHTAHDTVRHAATTLKAWQIGRFGLDALEQVERPVPQPGPHDLLVRIGAASLNYRDRLVIEGTFVPDLALPFVPASSRALEVIRLRPVIDRVYPFGEAPAAFEHLTRGAFGKIVIDVHGA